MIEIDNIILSSNILERKVLDLSCTLIIFLDRRVNNHIITQISKFFHLFLSLEEIDFSRIIIIYIDNEIFSYGFIDFMNALINGSFPLKKMNFGCIFNII